MEPKYQGYALIVYYLLLGSFFVYSACEYARPVGGIGRWPSARSPTERVSLHADVIKNAFDSRSDPPAQLTFSQASWEMPNCVSTAARVTGRLGPAEG